MTEQVEEIKKRAKKGNFRAAKNHKTDMYHSGEWRQGVAKAEKLHLANIIEGEPFNPKAKYKKFSDALVKMDKDYKPIKNKCSVGSETSISPRGKGHGPTSFSERGLFFSGIGQLSDRA